MDDAVNQPSSFSKNRTLKKEKSSIPSKLTFITFFTIPRCQICLLSSPPPFQPPRKSQSAAPNRLPAPLHTPIVKLYNLIECI